MRDDHLQEGLRAYADRVERGATVAPANEIRRRAGLRRRNRTVGAAFAVVLVTALGAGLAVNRGGDQGRPFEPAVTPSTSVSPSTGITARPGPRPTGNVTSDVSQLRQLGVDLQTGVLIDAADDGVDRWMQFRDDATVDFTGTAKDSSTEMVLHPAPTTAVNSVQIVPKAFGNQCVAATQAPPLKLVPCEVNDASQVWRVVPAGDSGQFELEGAYGILRVDGGLITTSSGYSGLQTIRF
ncbi:hypothetical protein ACFOOK_01130 [Micromonospora krabiensis]|uniref:Uncharacterized protein n=1 Tax=Micromonospora krabiensis TaxID=307121 RepID=A0A1C3MXH1_9ACTN|nr:hypothetical protein [Micromonospora krabiensis]SBV25015.1 hypothetical protein GA0070620_0483 [Micromonospora krabiensis]